MLGMPLPIYGSVAVREFRSARHIFFPILQGSKTEEFRAIGNRADR
jgi:hypothetical protein